MISKALRPICRLVNARLYSAAKVGQLSPDDLATNIETNYKVMHETYDHRPSDLNEYRKMLVYRSKHLGMKELDMLIGIYAELHLENLDKKELDRFDEEIIQLETPDLHKLLSSTSEQFAKEELPKEHFLNQIREFGSSPAWRPLDYI